MITGRGIWKERSKGKKWIKQSNVKQKSSLEKWLITLCNLPVSIIVFYVVGMVQKIIS